MGSLLKRVLVPVIVLWSAGAAVAQDAMPVSQLAEAGRQLLAAMNGGSREGVEAFVRAYASAEGLRSMAPEDQVSFWETVRRQSGGLTLVKGDTVPSVLELRVKTVRGNRYGHLYMFYDRKERGKYSEAGIIPITDPALEERLSFPQRRMGRAAAIAEIDARVREAARNDLFSGVVMVADDRQILYEHAAGVAEESFNVPVNRDTKFHLGSVGKMFTSVAIAQLVEAGKLRFTDTLAAVLPDYPDQEAARKITIHHLLTHSAGLRMLFDNPAYEKQKKYRTHMDLVRVFASQPLLFEPGTQVSYSNEGYVVLGAVIEKVTGESYADYVREHICKPAGMTGTDCYRVDETVPNLAVGYGWFEDDPLGLAERRPNWMFLSWRGNACGGGYSTAPDLVNFARALRSNVLLSREMTELVTTPKATKSYGYGFQSRLSDGTSVRGHGGGGPNSGISADVQIIWEAGVTVIVLSNHDSPFTPGFCGRIADFLARTEGS